MAKGIELGIGSETKAFKQGIESGVITPLEDAVDALTDLGKSKGPAKLEEGLKDAQTASRRLQAETKDTARAIEQEYREAYRSVGESSRKAGREQTNQHKESLDEIKNEAKANAAETFSSFDGSASSFVDGIQGTLGGLVSSLGPIGLAAGAAGALAIGLINGALANADTQSQEFKQSVSDMTAELIESGNVGKVSVGYIVDELRRLATEADSAKPSLTKLDDLAKKSGTNYEDLAQAYSGNEDALRKLAAAGKQKLEQDQLQAETLSRLSVEQKRAQGLDSDSEASALRKGEAQKSVNTYLEQASEKAAQAAEQQRLYVEAGGPELERKAQLISQIDSAYDEAAGSVDDYIDKESGLFDTDAYIAAMQTKQKALEDYQLTLASSGLSDQAKTFLAAQGEDAAATLLAGYKNGSEAQKAALASIWNEAGKTSSGNYTASLLNGIPKSIPGPTVTPVLDDTAAQAAIRRLTGQTLKVTIDGIARNGVKLF